ncbi:MAG: hypothetical protein ACI8TP_003208 [Acidimicrobiales bacterium]
MAAQGLPVVHLVAGVSTQGTEPSAIVVVVDDPELGRARPMLRGIREQHPTQPIVLLSPTGDLRHMSRIAETVDVILPTDTRPLDVVVEVGHEMARRLHPNSVALLGEGAARSAVL